jgi:hypothetical protein
MRLIDVATGAVTTPAGSGSGTFADGTGSAASFYNAFGMAYSADGSTIAVADSSNNRVCDTANVQIVNCSTSAGDLMINYQIHSSNTTDRATAWVATELWGGNACQRGRAARLGKRLAAGANTHQISLHRLTS